ncbi:MAG: hypothetical protein GY796_16455 [Chloroflexi bacterium]|nr:hypothetical protein [Chloroflexota bacterium]
MYDALEHIALDEFSDMVKASRQIGRRTNTPLKLRLDIRDGTYVDIWLSPDGARCTFHWE